jgi:hypothetical protein
MHLRRLSDIMDHGGGNTSRVEGIGPALQLRAAALLDLVLAAREPGEERIDVRADLVRRAEAGVGGDLFAHPGPDVLMAPILLHILSSDTDKEMELANRGAHQQDMVSCLAWADPDASVTVFATRKAWAVASRRAWVSVAARPRYTLRRQP